MKKYILLFCSSLLLTACNLEDLTGQRTNEIETKQKESAIKRFAMDNRIFGSVLAKELSETKGVFTLSLTEKMYNYMQSQVEEDFDIAFNDYMFQEQGLNLFLTRKVDTYNGIKEATYTLYNKYKFSVKEGNQLFEKVPVNMVMFRHNEVITNFACDENEEPQIVAEELTIGETPQYGVDLQNTSTGKRVVLQEETHRLLVIPYCAKTQ